MGRYHDEIIETILDNLDIVTAYLGFSPSNIELNRYIDRGEIDIIIENETRRALIEVKENIGGMQKFSSKQYHKYRRFDPLADIYLVMGTLDKSLDIYDLTIRRY